MKKYDKNGLNYCSLYNDIINEYINAWVDDINELLDVAISWSDGDWAGYFGQPDAGSMFDCVFNQKKSLEFWKNFIIENFEDKKIEEELKNDCLDSLDDCDEDELKRVLYGLINSLFNDYYNWDDFLCVRIALLESEKFEEKE